MSVEILPEGFFLAGHSELRLAMAVSGLLIEGDDDRWV